MSHSNLLNPNICWIILYLLMLLVKSNENAPCYYPTREKVDGFYPFDPAAYITTCCPQGYTYYSNSLCLVTTETESYPNLTIGDALRGACTNPFWNNAICGDKCLGESLRIRLVAVKRIVYSLLAKVEARQ